jgi:hypothetical protein
MPSQISVGELKALISNEPDKSLVSFEVSGDQVQIHLASRGVTELQFVIAPYGVAGFSSLTRQKEQLEYRFPEANAQAKRT